MRLYKLAWLIWICGTALIVLSWADAVSATVGWIGFGIALAGVALSFLPHRGYDLQQPAGSAEGLPPVEPSGIPVGPETPLEVGSAVLAYTQGRWWRARVVALEQGGRVRVRYEGWEPWCQESHERGQLQLDAGDAGASGVPSRQAQ